MTFLCSKFGGKSISPYDKSPWPSRSPDLNVLDYFYWGHASQEVIHQNPQSIEEVQNIVENVVAALEEDVIRFAVSNVL